MPKAFDPEDPMELVGVGIPDGDLDQALDAIVQEYLLMGWNASQILFLFRNPHYAATHQIYLQKGEACVRDRIQGMARQWARGWIVGGVPSLSKEGDAHGQGL